MDDWIEEMYEDWPSMNYKWVYRIGAAVLFGGLAALVWIYSEAFASLLGM